MWSGEGLLETDRTLPEGAETSSVSEISSHVCESFLMSPENTLECEQPIRKVYQSLSSAVDGLLEMALDSTKQVRPTAIPEASGGVGRQSWADVILPPSLPGYRFSFQPAGYKEYLHFSSSSESMGRPVPLLPLGV